MHGRGWVARKMPLSTRLWREHLRLYWPRLLLITFLMLLVAGSSSLYPLMIGYGTDWATQGDRRVLTVAPFFIMMVVTLKAVSLFVQTVVTQNLALQIVNDLQNRQFRHMLSWDYARFTHSRAGEMASRFTNDMMILRETLVRLANNLIRDALTVLGVFAMLIYINWQLTLLVIALYPIAFYPVIRIGKLIRSRSTNLQEEAGLVTDKVTEAVQNITLIKHYDLQEQESQKASRRFALFRQIAQRVATFKAVIDPLLEIAGGLAFTVVLAFIGWQIIAGQSTLGDLTGFVAGVAILAPALRALGTMSAVVQEGFAALDRAFAQIDLPVKIQSPIKAARTPRNVKGNIRFDQVCFGYDGAENLLFDGLTLKINPGESVALVGPSGGGKSTIFRLLARLYDPESGEITIDGIDLRDWPLAKLRTQISVVSQDAELFHASIAENIRLGRLDANDDEIIAAAKAAEAWDFIQQLPEGPETTVGQRGASLSGGQKQRIALARAFLRDAPILLLDEATSALDTQTEAKIQAAIARLTKECTSLTIAHRLATIRDVDRIFVLEQGKIMQSGSHSQLRSEPGLYRELSKKQLASE